MLSRRNLCLLLSGAGTLYVARGAVADSWRTYRNQRFGTTIEYPDRFRPGRPPANGDGLAFTSADGASFSVWGSHNVLNHDLAGLEAFIREKRSPGERITYNGHGPNWFVISGFRGDMVFYERHMLSHRGTIVNGFSILYPTRLKAAYDPIVTRMARSFRAGRGSDTKGNP
jgi:hypothetical protein